MSNPERTRASRPLLPARFVAGTLLLGVLFLLHACTSTRRAEATSPPEEPRIVRAEPLPTSELALLMREMTAFTDSTGRRLTDGLGLPPYPGHFEALRTAEATPGMMDSTNFQPYAIAWMHHLNTLYTSPEEERPRVFNALVNTCSACHTKMCPGPLSRIQRLHLPEKE